ncbi:pimeloyl-ACP methyl ester carboxylesterase [Cryobacterium sp. MP_M5]|uniref:alpha/beta fold hydrolase n=1 Tax=unclassified Cryobacterium TaxID=2649013 RepID=UPI0018C9CF31|nr:MULTISPECIES: alpha/beta hydrolase [unclassified Cryobacterium]MBG6057860.1 pimeloyl-ACP methyl ester carboxylesterase [Cryobacterium sp. MP_M3]MEC5176059.1 pimeloyl-ACP methyl ester carboxylesterase [Cryobacterium sp. MP_M5]
MTILLTRPVRAAATHSAPPAPPAPPRATEDYCPFPLTSDPRRFGLTTSTMRLRGGTIVVRHGRRTAGDTATILLHGAAGSWTTWTPLLQSARSAGGAGFTDLIIPDLPGWGDSTLTTEAGQANAAAPGIEATAALIAEIAEALGYRRWQVLGHSMGGFIALELAASFVAETASVGLVSATTYAVIDSVRHPVSRFGILPAYTALLGVMRVLAGFGRGGTSLVRALDRLGMLRPLTAPLFARVAAVHPSVISALATEVRPDRFAAASALAGRYDADAAWSRIRCPVRAVRGSSDAFVAEADTARLRRVIRDFTPHTLPGTGHFGHVERPGETLRLLGPVPTPTPIPLSTTVNATTLR